MTLCCCDVAVFCCSEENLESCSTCGEFSSSLKNCSKCRQVGLPGLHLATKPLKLTVLTLSHYVTYLALPPSNYFGGFQHKYRFFLPCIQAKYCGVECQKLAWTVGNHKKLCKKWTLKQAERHPQSPGHLKENTPAGDGEGHLKENTSAGDREGHLKENTPAGDQEGHLKENTPAGDQEGHLKEKSSSLATTAGDHQLREDCSSEVGASI